MSGFKVTELFAFIAVHEDGDEGVMGFKTPDGTMMPMIGADMTRVDGLRMVADQIAKHTGTEYKLKKFTEVCDWNDERPIG